MNPHYLFSKDTAGKFWIFKLGPDRRVTHEKWFAGNDEEKIVSFVDDLNISPKANLRQDEDGLYVCWGDHDRSTPCEWQKALSYSTLDRIEAAGNPYIIKFDPSAPFYPGFRHPDKVLLLKQGSDDSAPATESFEVNPMSGYMKDTSGKPFFFDEAGQFDFGYRRPFDWKAKPNFMNKATRQEVYAALDTERDYQDKLGADRTDGRQHQLAGFITMMNHYMQKLNEAWTVNAGDEEALNVVRKLGGIAVHAMEKHGAIARK